ncbi:hypothetical protein [Paraburkholderia sp. EG304]
MVTVSLVLLVVALVLFALAALSVPVPRVNLIGAGLAAWVLVELVGHFAR